MFTTFYFWFPKAILVKLIITDRINKSTTCLFALLLLSKTRSCTGIARIELDQQVTSPISILAIPITFATLKDRGSSIACAALVMPVRLQLRTSHLRLLADAFGVASITTISEARSPLCRRCSLIALISFILLPPSP